MTFETAVAGVFGVCLCLAMVALAILGSIVRDYFKFLSKENSDLKFENELLVGEVDKAYGELEETQTVLEGVQKVLEDVQQTNLAYVKRLYGTHKNKNVACSAGTEQTTVI